MHVPNFSLSSAVLLALSIQDVSAGTSKWFSPEYKNFFSVPLPMPTVKQPKSNFTNQNTGGIINYYEVDIKPVEVQIYPPPMKKARLIGYDGLIPGPTFMQERGEEAVVRFINHGDRASSIHLHGSYTRAPFDGYADDITPVGGYKDYYYPNGQNARTLWYHDHAVDHTAENAYYGQAGFYILTDPEERALNLPSGKYDIPLALAAKFYNQDGTLWDPEANGEETSVYGDVIHVNGAPWPYLNVEPRKYRFRMLNTGISRSYKLYLENAAKAGTKLPFTVIGSDCGLTEKPVNTTDLFISDAERWEIVVDFTQYEGQTITMRNTPGIAADVDYPGTDKVMQFRVGTKASVTSQVGNGALAPSFRNVPYPPMKSGIDQSLVFERGGSLWTVNGHTWGDGVEARVLAKPKRGSIEIWELINKSGGWSHPIHIHLIDFQVIKRTGGRGIVEPYEQVALKDVVWLGPNERVQVMARYAPWDGVYMFHCHNLIHEDHEMMATFNVTMLQDFNYTETTHFIDPMEQRYRAKMIENNDYNSVSAWGTNAFSWQGVYDKIAWFASLDAYKNVGAIETALDNYWATKTTTTTTPAATPAPPPATTLVTSASPAAASSSTTPSSIRSTTTLITSKSSTKSSTASKKTCTKSGKVSDDC